MAGYDLQGLYVTRSGRIENGTFRTLAISVSERGVPDEGGWSYSDELLRYSYPIFRARIGIGHVEVINQGRIILEVDSELIYPVDHVYSGFAVVHEGGWLLKPSWSECHKEILAAERGRRHKHDNSNFVKVDPELEGRRFLLLRAGFDSRLYRVIDPRTRQIISCSVEHPFASATATVPLPFD